MATLNVNAIVYFCTGQFLQWRSICFITLDINYKTIIIIYIRMYDDTTHNITLNPVNNITKTRTVYNIVKQNNKNNIINKYKLNIRIPNI